MLTNLSKYLLGRISGYMTESIHFEVTHIKKGTILRRYTVLIPNSTNKLKVYFLTLCEPPSDVTRSQVNNLKIFRLIIQSLLSN